MIPCIKTELPGPKSREYFAISKACEPPSIGDQSPVVWESAENSVVTDVDGNVFLDFTSGVLVTNIGHSHPDHVAAVREQAGELMNTYTALTPSRALLAQKLVEITPPSLDRAYIVSTGSEAVEAAIKMARYATGRFEVISFHGGFHGRTFGAMAAGGKAGVKRGFGPLLPGFLHLPFPYCYRCPFGSEPASCKLHTTEHLDWLLETESVGLPAALLVEPYQGAAGSIMAPDGWLKRVFEWCCERDIVFILDEVQSSFGRVGSMFAFEQEGFVPHLVCLGKGVGCGVPLAAVVGESRIMDALPVGSMGSTYGGNPLSCRAGFAAIEVLQNERLPERAARLGCKIEERLCRIARSSRIIGDVRGKGMVWGLELVEEKTSRKPNAPATAAVVDAAIRRGLLLISPIGFYGNVIRLAPPLTMPEDQLDTALDILQEAVRIAEAAG